jgi:hypothetical protein
MTLTANPRTTTTEPEPPHPTVGDIAPGQPVRLYPVNPWLPWVNRVGGATIGVVLAATVSILLGSPLVWQAAATAITAALVFAWFVAGYELHEKRPKTFKAAR